MTAITPTVTAMASVSERTMARYLDSPSPRLVTGRVSTDSRTPVALSLP